MLETVVAPVGGFEVPEAGKGNKVRIEALPARVYQTPQYGEVPVTREKLERMVKNFNNRVRGQDVALDFDHGMDRAKGNKAAGWYKELEVGPSSEDPNQFSLFAVAELTDEAMAEVRDQQWRYFSLEWDDLWSDNDGNKFEDVIIGGGLTNRPIAKHTMPLNFSETMWDELDDDTRREFAVWSTAEMNNLPDSSFLYVESGSKDSEGKTVPRSLRHFPYKDGSGKIDLPHLRNAIARIPQSSLSADLKSSLQAKARAILAKNGGSSDKSMSEDWFRSQFGLKPLLEENNMTFSEMKKLLGLAETATEEEVTEAVQGLHTTTTQFSEILEVEPAKVVETITNLHKENKAFKEAVAASAEEKQFAEKFPTMWREHQDMIATDRVNKAHAFSESIKTITRTEGDKQVPTKSGLSALALEKAEDLHKKFAEGTATQADFEEVMNTVVHGGLVDYGEKGSSQQKEFAEIDTSTAEGVANMRKLFAEKVAEIQTEDKLPYREAINVAAQKYPDLAEAYINARMVA